MLIGFASFAEAAGGVAYVNYPELLNKAPQSEASRELLKREFATRLTRIKNEHAAVKKLSVDLQSLDPDVNQLERASAIEKLKSARATLKNDEQSYDTAMTLRQQQLVADLKDLILKEIQASSRLNHFTVVLEQGVLYAAPDVDITQEVLARLAQDYAAAQAGLRKQP
ncbi:MAG: OmpH family outer membrane protein [Terriglobia bacterium]